VLPVEGRLALEPADTGAVLRGIIISEKENWIINRVRVHVRISETRHCGEKLQDPFSDIEWDKHCAENPNHSVADVVEGKGYEMFCCFNRELKYADPKAFV
jgi:predicted metalloenzyme YecM